MSAFGRFDETTWSAEEILRSAAEKRTGSYPQDSRETMEALLLEYPVYEYAFGKTKEIPFSEKVLQICQTDCLRYGHCWACPPHAGSILVNIKKVQSYDSFLLFSTLNEVQDSMIFDQCMEAKRPHEELTRDLRLRLGKTRESRFYMLSAGCMFCETCACPDEPCRHPEERLMTTESHGIVLLQLVQQLGMDVFSGGNMIPYYSLVLFDENEA